MQPITLPIAELKPALAGLGKIISSRPSLAILGNVKVERTSEGWIALTGTDLDRFVTVRFEHPAEGPPTAVLIPYNQLTQITKTCGRGENVIIDQTTHGTVIKFALADSLGEQKVPTIPVGEFPITPRIKTDAITLPADLRYSINEAMDCSSTDETRYVLNGTFIDTSNPKANYIVGTDGKHLYSANSFTLPLKQSVILPNHKFLGWKEFNADGDWQLRLDNKHVQLSSRRWRFISKQIEGTYPNWRQTIPSPDAAKTHITIDPANLDKVIKLIQRMPCHDTERYHTIGLEWKDGQFLLLGKDQPNEPWLRVPVSDIKGSGPEMMIFLNRRLLIKALQYGLNTISLICFVSPLRFHSKGRQMIVMPIRPDGGSAPPQAPQQQPAPVNLPPSRPVPPAAPQTPKPMINNPTPETPHSDGQKTPMEEAIDMSLIIRDKFNEGFNLLRELSLKLKGINRDQKASAREMQSVRSTLRSLQGMKL